MLRVLRATVFFAAFVTVGQAASLVFAPRAEALVLPLTFTEMTQRSKYVVTGEVVSLRSYIGPFKDFGNVMFTDVTIRIEGVFKGAPDGNELTIQVLGGEIGDAFQRCLESPRYDKGEKVLVFLRDFNGALWNTGWNQGKYKIDASSAMVKGDEELPISRDVALSTVEANVRKIASATTPQPSSPQPAKEGGAK
jgi:hypothetical protein